MRRAVRRGLTGRALVLVGVVVLLVVVLAAPLHRYLSIRSAIAQAEQQQRDTRARIGTLKQQLAQWDDPAFVAAQARDRLQYAMPGDTVYVIVTPSTPSTAGAGVSSPVDTGATKVPGRTWNERLWGSVQGADAAP
ncbi:MAG: septum formation initiator family protein [Actinomycetota bacterium]